MRVEVKHTNPPKATASQRVKFPINLQTPAPTSRQNAYPHTPTSIVTYEEDKYTPLRVESNTIYGLTPPYNTQHQKWLRNVHNQLKYTPHLISNRLQENLEINDPTEIQHDYLTKIANAIIDEDTGIAMEYRHLVKNPKQRPVCIKSFANDIVRISQ